MNIRKYKPKNKLNGNVILSLDDLNEDDIYEVMLLAYKLKQQKAFREKFPALEDEIIALMIGSKNSVLRVPFELSIQQLGGKTLYVSPKDESFARGVTQFEEIKLLHSYGVRGIILKSKDKELLKTLSQKSPMPVINTSNEHDDVCGVLASLLSILEKSGDFSDKRLAVVGDLRDVSTSAINAFAKVGMPVTLICPEGFAPDTDRINEASQYEDVVITSDLKTGLKNIDIVTTFLSRQEYTEEEKAALLPYRITRSALSYANYNAFFMHALPVNRELEADEDLLENYGQTIFAQSENLIYVLKALLILTMKK